VTINIRQIEDVLVAKKASGSVMLGLALDMIWAAHCPALVS
jgi:hypothetical protein